MKLPVFPSFEVVAGQLQQIRYLGDYYLTTKGGHKLTSCSFHKYLIDKIEKITNDIDAYNCLEGSVKLEAYFNRIFWTIIDPSITVDNNGHGSSIRRFSQELARKGLNGISDKDFFAVNYSGSSIESNFEIKKCVAILKKIKATASIFNTKTDKEKSNRVRKKKQIEEVFISIKALMRDILNDYKSLLSNHFSVCSVIDAITHYQMSQGCKKCDQSTECSLIDCLIKKHLAGVDHNEHPTCALQDISFRIKELCYLSLQFSPSDTLFFTWSYGQIWVKYGNVEWRSDLQNSLHFAIDHMILEKRILIKKLAALHRVYRCYINFFEQDDSILNVAKSKNDAILAKEVMSHYMSSLGYATSDYEAYKNEMSYWRSAKGRTKDPCAENTFKAWVGELKKAAYSSIIDSVNDTLDDPLLAKDLVPKKAYLFS